MRVVNQQVPTPFPGHRPGHGAAAELREFVGRARGCHCASTMSCARWPGSLGSVSAMDLAAGTGQGAAVRDLHGRRHRGSTCATVLSDPDRTDDFRLLEPELYLTATDLDTCERIVFGAEGWDDVPISARRTRLDGAADGLRAGPGQGRELVDGGIVSTTNLDIAVEAGAKLSSWSTRSCRTSTTSPRRSRRCSAAPRRVSDMGFPQIGYQAFKLLAYQRLHEMARQLGAALPGRRHRPDRAGARRRADVRDVRHELPARVDMARHGFESVTLKLAADYEHYREICERHGIEISATRVRKVVKHFARRAREDAGLAADPRADDRRAAAPVGRRD